jgi:hypothetical protein
VCRLLLFAIHGANFAAPGVVLGQGVPGREAKRREQHCNRELLEALETVNRNGRHQILLWRYIVREKTVCPAAPTSRRCGRFVSVNCFLPAFLE